MLSEDGIRARLKDMLSRQRYMHSLGVRSMAGRLAKHLGLDEEKAKLAGLVHDCARDLPGERLLELADTYKLHIDQIERLEPRLLHAPVGAIMARYEFGIEDEEIQRAIRLHTTASLNMKPLDKVLYVADYVEPGRAFKGARELRELAFRDFDAAYIQALEQTILYLIKRGGLIHPRTIEARNDALQRVRRGGVVNLFA